MRPENTQMKTFLSEKGISATPKFLWKGSMKGCWRLYNYKQQWNPELCDQLTSLGFIDFDGRPLHKFSGNGGIFSVFCRYKAV